MEKGHEIIQTMFALPQDFISRINQQFDPETAELICNGCTARSTSLRVNTLKTTKEALIRLFKQKNIELTEISWWENACIVNNTPQSIVTALPEYTEGLFYIQSLSSMIPPLILNPQPQEKVLDLCAAPGSKTTQMAALMKNEGEIVANDVSHIRLQKLEFNIKTQGVTNTKVTKIPGQILWKEYQNYFDKSLVDVPCSMEGRFIAGESKTYKDWTPKKPKLLSERQKFLLKSAISATKSEGIIVYSTCTLSIEENEGVIEWILKKMSDQVELEEIELKNAPLINGLTRWKEQERDLNVAKTKRILPSEQMEGFFIAKFKKK